MGLFCHVDCKAIHLCSEISSSVNWLQYELQFYPVDSQVSGVRTTQCNVNLEINVQDN